MAELPRLGRSGFTIRVPNLGIILRMSLLNLQMNLNKSIPSNKPAVTALFANSTHRSTGFSLQALRSAKLAEKPSS